MEKNIKYLLITSCLMLSGCINLSDATGNASSRDICSGKPAHMGAESKPCRVTFFKQSF
jgi:starvation-inducible outer membrane lipoprotein